MVRDLTRDKRHKQHNYSSLVPPSSSICHSIQEEAGNGIVIRVRRFSVSGFGRRQRKEEGRKEEAAELSFLAFVGESRRPEERPLRGE